MPLLVTPTVPAGSLAALPQPVLPLPTGHAVLRPWREEDAAALVAAYEDAAIQRWHVRRMDSEDEARETIRQWRAAWARETAGHWALAVPDEGPGRAASGAGLAPGALLGRLALKDFDLVDGGAEVGYWTVPAARGAALCPRALAVLSRWALERAGFRRLELEHSTVNEASCRVALKAGFEAEGVRRAAARHLDGLHDMHLHALLSP